MLQVMHRWARALPSAVGLLALTALPLHAAGPPFPDPSTDRAVYDTAGVLRPETVTELEDRIDAIEAETGAEVVVYTQVDPGVTEDENLANARALIDQWGIGRAGFDDGLVLLVGLEPDRVHGRVSLFGGSGFVNQHIDEEGLQGIVDDEFVPRARDGDLNAATLDAIDAVQERIAPDTVPLTVARVLNAVLGLIVAPLSLVAVLGLAWWRWKRDGDDPELIDSPSVLMAGPPADMTPPLATVVRKGSADQHSINTLLAELASTGRLAFRNLDRVQEVKRDDDPDPLTDPAIEVHPSPGDDERLPRPQREAWQTVRGLVGGKGGALRRERLWRLNDELGDVKTTLESEAVRLGWLERMPGPAITAMTVIGAVIAVAGAITTFIGINVPMSGAVMLGIALVLGGVGTIGFGRAMSKRTAAGAYVDAMLTAYRRTLAKTLDLARNMNEVVEQPEIARLADTPDKAVVWGLALGLHDKVAEVLARGLSEQRAATGSPAGAYYPGWLGSSPGSAWTGSADVAGGVSHGSGSIFSSSAVPDIGGMFSALGSIGSTPASSSSSSGGGGFGGGGGGGGGGGSGSF